MFDLFNYLLEHISNRITMTSRSIDKMLSENADIIREIPLLPNFVRLYILIPAAFIASKEASLSKDRFQRHFALIIYHEDSVYLLENSLLNALAAHYGAAYINLRPAMEAMIKGLFFDSLTLEKNRKMILGESIRFYRDMKNIIRLIEIIDEEKPLDSAEVLDIIDGVSNRNLLQINFRTMLDLLLFLGILDEKSDMIIKDELEKIYNYLSAVVHRSIPSYTEAGLRGEWRPWQLSPDIKQLEE